MTGTKGVAVVTGAARGIGRQIASDLLAAGYTVVFGDLNLKQTEATALEVSAKVIEVNFLGVVQATKVVLPLRTGRFESFVPRRLGPVIRLSRLLPTRVQDWLDDRIVTDRIGLGGNPAARAAYIDEAMRKEA